MDFIKHLDNICKNHENLKSAHSKLKGDLSRQRRITHNLEVRLHNHHKAFATLSTRLELKCAVCQERKELCLFHCSHFVCDGCLIGLLNEDEPKCPICRADLEEDPLLNE